MSHRRVVVTGMGIVSPIGNTLASAWESIEAGRSGIGQITHFDASAYATRIAGEVRDFDAKSFLPPKDVKKMDTFIHYGLAACFQAMDDAGLEVTEANAERIGVLVGSGIGGVRGIEDTAITLHEGGPRKVSPFYVPSTIINMLPGQLTIMKGIKGPNFSAVSACATANHSVGLAMRRGTADAAPLEQLDESTEPAQPRSAFIDVFYRWLRQLRQHPYKRGKWKEKDSSRNHRHRVKSSTRNQHQRTNRLCCTICNNKAPAECRRHRFCHPATFKKAKEHPENHPEWETIHKHRHWL